MNSSVDRGRQLYRASRTAPDRRQDVEDETGATPPTEEPGQPGAPSVARGAAMWRARHPQRQPTTREG